MTSPIMLALKIFEAAEANLEKLERLWNKAESLMPAGISFGENADYDDARRSIDAVVAALPRIDAWKPSILLPALNEIAQNRFDAMEVGELDAKIAVEESISEPGRAIRDYRFRFNQKRRELVRDALLELIASIDHSVLKIRKEVGEDARNVAETAPDLEELRAQFDQIRVLLGKNVPRNARWADLMRHLGYGTLGDFNDIERMDWPSVKGAIVSGLYGEDEPIPVAVDDLSNVVAAKPRGSVSLKLEWQKIDEEQFERLMFRLISAEPGYENPEWLMQTNAPDRGRDLSVTRISVDNLAGTTRARVIIQCKHWLSKSISVADVALARDQMALWPNPLVDVLVLATSGRFTADAVQVIEKHNADQRSPKIEKWAESHLERLLAARPALIADFGLR